MFENLAHGIIKSAACNNVGSRLRLRSSALRPKAISAASNKGTLIQFKPSALKNNLMALSDLWRSSCGW